MINKVFIPTLLIIIVLLPDIFLSGAISFSKEEDSTTPMVNGLTETERQEVVGAIENIKEYVEWYKRWYEKEKESRIELDLNFPIAECYRTLKEYRKAIEVYKQVIKNSKPNVKSTIYPDAQMGIADCYRKLGEYDKAIETYQQVETWMKEIIFEAHLLIGDCLRDMKKNEEAKNQYEKVLQEVKDHMRKPYPHDETANYHIIPGERHKSAHEIQERATQALKIISYQSHGINP
jgi:tetratricopeptide (TPR) repeat protein